MVSSSALKGNQTSLTDMKILGSGGTGRVSGLCPSQPWRAGSSCATLYNTVTQIAGSGHSAAGNTYIIHTFEQNGDFFTFVALLLLNITFKN